MRFVVGTAAFLLFVGCALSGCAVAVTGQPVAVPNVGAPVLVPDLPPGAFADPAGRFELVPPSGWVVDTSGSSGTAALFLAPRPAAAAAGQFTANLNVLIVPTAAGLTDTVSDARREVSSVSGYRVLADEPFTLADGTPGYLLGGRFDDPAGFALRNVQLFTVHENRTVVVTGTALADGWAEYAPEFDAALHTVSVAPAPS